MAAIILLVLKASIILSVFAIGLQATFGNAFYLFRRPDQLVRTWLSMSVVMPLFASTLVLLLDLHPAIQIALIGISVSPIPPIFPNIAFRAGGAGNYTIGLLAGSAVVSVIVLPVTLEPVERIVGIPLQMRAGTVAWTVLTTIFFPLLVGIGVRALAPNAANRLAKPLALFRDRRDLDASNSDRLREVKTSCSARWTGGERPPRYIIHASGKRHQF